MSLFDLSGKVAIVTGSSRGIGRAIAEQMAVQGAKVVISSRKIEACQEVVDAITRATVPARPLRSQPISRPGTTCNGWSMKPTVRSARSTFSSAMPHRIRITAR